INDGQLTRRDRKLRTPVQPFQRFAFQIGRWIEIVDLPCDPTVQSAGIEASDRTDRRTRTVKPLPESLHTASNRCDGSDPGHDHLPSIRLFLPVQSPPPLPPLP